MCSQRRQQLPSNTGRNLCLLSLYCRKSKADWTIVEQIGDLREHRSCAERWGKVFATVMYFGGQTVGLRVRLSGVHFRTITTITNTKS